MEAKLENQNVRFYLKAPANSPIWGNAEDMTDWLRNWHECGCPTGKNVVPEPVVIVGVDPAIPDSDVTVTATVEEGKVTEIVGIDYEDFKPLIPATKEEKIVPINSYDPYGGSKVKVNKYVVRNGELKKVRTK